MKTELELGFTFPDALNTTLFCPDNDGDGLRYTVRTLRCVTTIARLEPRLDGEDASEKTNTTVSKPVARIDWRARTVTTAADAETDAVALADDAAVEKSIPLDSFMPHTRQRWRWTDHSRTFGRFVWRDRPLRQLELVHQDGALAATLYCGHACGDQWTLRVLDDRAIEILDGVVLSAVMMLKLRIDRQWTFSSDEDE